MPSTASSLTALALGLSTLIVPTIASPLGYKPEKRQDGDSYDPFSQEHWPMPHKITGDNVTDDPTAWHGGHGGIHLHDPSIVMGPDGHYYSFSTHGLGVTSRASEKNSLDGYWEIIGQVLTAPGSIIDPDPEEGPRLWAPDVHRVDDTYYCYYSISSFGTSNSTIGLATSETLQNGSWTDHGAVISSGDDADPRDIPYPLNITNAIDAALYHDPETGISYFTYGSWWGNIWQFVLNDDLRSVKLDTAVQLSYTFEEGLTKEEGLASHNETWGGTGAEEGSYVSYSQQTGYYYLWYSAGFCCGYDPENLPAPGEEYSVRMGRSESPRGPFVDRNGTDLAEGGGSLVFGSHGEIYGPGGQAVVSNYRGRDVLYYHYVDLSFNPTYNDNLKLMGWNYITYIEDWPVLSHE